MSLDEIGLKEYRSKREKSFFFSPKIALEWQSFQGESVIRLMSLLSTKEWNFFNFIFYDNWGFTGG